MIKSHSFSRSKLSLLTKLPYVLVGLMTFLIIVLSGLLLELSPSESSQTQSEETESDQFPLDDSQNMSASSSGFADLASLRTLPDRSFISLSVGDDTLQVESIHDSASVILGLSGREVIGSDGLLFLMPSSEIQTFWMKEMKFDIDIVWINDGEIIGISENVPAPSPSIPLNQLPLYRSPGPAEQVLEVTAGTSGQLGWQVGDQVRLLSP